MLDCFNAVLLHFYYFQKAVRYRYFWLCHLRQLCRHLINKQPQEAARINHAVLKGDSPILLSVLIGFFNLLDLKNSLNFSESSEKSLKRIQMFRCFENLSIKIQKVYENDYNHDQIKLGTVVPK